MLVVSVREGERVLLRDDNGTESVVVVVSIRSGKEIRLGFAAPSPVKILREKLITEKTGEIR